MGKITFVREKFVQNMVKTVKNVRQEIVVHVSSPLRRRGIVGSVYIYRPSRLALRTDASRRCLSAAITIDSGVEKNYDQSL